MNHKLAEEFLLQLSEAENELPVSPELLGDLFGQTSEECCVSLDEAALTISKDQGLTSRILARANSAYYGVQGKISSISRAVNLLGLAELRKILLFVAASSLGKKTRTDIFDLRQYWDHQCFVAVLAAELGSLCGRRDSQDLFISGILHDMGKLMTALYQPLAWTRILETASRKGLSHFQAEHEFWGIDHAMAGAMTLRRWNLPEAITEPINAHHSPQSIEDTYKNQAIILNLANSISHNINNDLFQAETLPFDQIGLNAEQAMHTARQVSSDPSLPELRSLFTT
ncbi:MAG: HDOD domain-containing protein [Desulfonatronovibrio sp.]